MQECGLHGVQPRRSTLQQAAALLTQAFEVPPLMPPNPRCALKALAPSFLVLLTTSSTRSQLSGCCGWRLQLRGRLLRRLWPLAAVPTAFAAFAVANGGIVVGDKAAHAPARHLVQPLYFAVFAVRRCTI